MSAKLILLRHGQSVWNQKNLFTGWVDIPLSEQGIQEAMRAGEKIRAVPIDVIFTSSLIRAQMTLCLSLLNHTSGKYPRFLHHENPKMEKWSEIYSEETARSTIPVHIASELNERMYGCLQGLNKEETAQKYGAEQVHLWRRSYDIPPPEGESLKMTADRSVPYFKNHILPHLEKGENVFICAHGNSLRSIVMNLEGLTPDEVLKLELATGAPLIYTFEKGKWLKST
jgi:2,3-bisphosphoglycerate-dependent phosphoglycerate mutase